MQTPNRRRSLQSPSAVSIADSSPSSGAHGRRNQFQSPQSLASSSSVASQHSSPSMFSEDKQNHEKLGPHDIGKHMHVHSCSHMDNVDENKEIDYATLVTTVLGDLFQREPVERDGGLEDEQDQNAGEEKRNRRLKKLPKASRVDVWEHDLDLIKNCCLTSEEDQTPEMINRLAIKRLRFCKLDRSYQSEVILDLMRNNRNSKAFGDGLQTALVCQFPFCTMCVRRIYGLSLHRWNVYYNMHISDPNRRRLLRADISGDREGLKESHFTKFLFNVKKDLGEQDPASKFTYLPYQSRKEYWKWAKKEGEILYPWVDWRKSESSFRKVWRGTKYKPSPFADLLIKKNPPIGKCTECKTTLDLLFKAQTKEEILDIRRRRSEHFRNIRDERLVYKDHVKKATIHWADYASLAIDGMDQAKTAVPFANGKRDRDEQGQTTQARVICVQVHGVGSCFYVASAEIPHTVDTTITCLMDSFRFLKKTNGKVAPYLFIQMDNTNADNKTHVFFAWAATVVQSEVFRQVEVSFLPAGHTHADVDQKFSHISRYLGRNPVHTFAELAQACKRALPNECIYSIVLKRSWIVNFKRFYEVQQRFNKTIFHGSRDIHGFLFDITCVDEQGQVRLQTKEWTRFEDWIPAEDKIKLKLPRTLYLVPAHSLLSLPELDKVISKLTDKLELDEDENMESDLESDTSAAEDWEEGQGGRRGWRRQPTEYTLRTWLKVRAHQVKDQQDDCEECVRLASEHRDVVISKRLSDVENAANRAKKQTAAKQLQDHLEGGRESCSRDLTLNEEAIGKEAWVFYKQLLGENDQEEKEQERQEEDIDLQLSAQGDQDRSNQEQQSLQEADDNPHREESKVAGDVGAAGDVATTCSSDAKNESKVSAQQSESKSLLSQSHGAFPDPLRREGQQSLPSDTSNDVRPDNLDQLLTAANVHEGNIEILDNFQLPFPDAGRPTQGAEKKKDDSKHSLVKKRKGFLQTNDMVVARVEYGQGGESSQQPVCVFKIVKLFKDRHRCATWMRVRWYGQEQDVFLGKYVEKKEKLSEKDVKAIERIRRQGGNPEQDIQFKITPDENLFLCATDGSNTVQGRRFEPPLIVHWGKEGEILTRQTKNVRDTVVRLITSDVRLLNLPGLNIKKVVEQARQRKKRPKARSGKAVRDSPVYSAESSPSSSDCDEANYSSAENPEIQPCKRRRKK